MTVVALLAPSLAGLYFRRVDARAIWWTVGLSFPLGLGAKFTPRFRGMPLADPSVTGVLLPIAVTVVVIALQRTRAPVALPFRGEESGPESGGGVPAAPRLPVRILGASLLVCGATLLALVPLNSGHRTPIVGAAVAVAAPGVLCLLPPGSSARGPSGRGRDGARSGAPSDGPR